MVQQPKKHPAKMLMHHGLRGGGPRKNHQNINLLLLKTDEDIMTLSERFIAFDRKNPHIYGLFCKYTNEAIGSGKTKLSHWLVINRIRWDAEVTTNTTEPYKISNDFIALYARKFIHDHPNHAEFFDIKEMKRV